MPPKSYGVFCVVPLKVSCHLTNCTVILYVELLVDILDYFEKLGQRNLFTILYMKISNLFR